MLLNLNNKIWQIVKDGDAESRAIFHRHYSYRPYRDGRKPLLFVGPGQKMVLVTADYSALFIWRKFISADGQQGVNCSVFRNEGKILSSKLILEAECMAQAKWPGERFYTYVNSRKVYGDGACFKHAGWKKVGRTKHNRLVILAKESK